MLFEVLSEEKQRWFTPVHYALTVIRWLYMTPTGVMQLTRKSSYPPLVKSDGFFESLRELSRLSKQLSRLNLLNCQRGSSASVPRGTPRVANQPSSVTLFAQFFDYPISLKLSKKSVHITRCTFTNDKLSGTSTAFLQVSSLAPRRFSAGGCLDWLD